MTIVTFGFYISVVMKFKFIKSKRIQWYLLYWYIFWIFVDGYCPKGWIAHAQYCYQFHTDPSEYRSWDDARDACEQGHNSSSYGELVSIHDE